MTSQYAIPLTGSAESAPSRDSRANATRGWASLSPAERKVAELASEGLNNPDIGRVLFISRNTVKVHLSRVYVKLGVANRIQLARLTARSWSADNTELR